MSAEAYPRPRAAGGVYTGPIRDQPRIGSRWATRQTGSPRSSHNHHRLPAIRPAMAAGDSRGDGMPHSAAMARFQA
ncbi:hypothetical protein ACWEVD_28040 [Nocardia thailandica]